MINDKRELIARENGTRRERFARFQAIRAINESLQKLVRESCDSLQVQKSQILMGLEWNRLAHGREYALVVHSAQRLHKFMMELGTEIDP